MIHAEAIVDVLLGEADEADPGLLKDVAAYGMNPPWKVARDAWEAATRYYSGNPWIKVFRALGYDSRVSEEVADEIANAMDLMLRKAEVGEITWEEAPEVHWDYWKNVIESEFLPHLQMSPEHIAALKSLWAYLAPEQNV